MLKLTEIIKKESAVTYQSDDRFGSVVVALGVAGDNAVFQQKDDEGRCT